MKRSLSMLLAVILCISLCACGSSSSSTSAEAAAPAIEEEITPTSDPAKSAYENIQSAYETVHEFGSDLHNAWHMACYESDKLLNSNTVKQLSSDLQYLSEDDITLGLAYVLAKNKYQENWDELTESEKCEYIESAKKYAGDDFSHTTNCIFMTTWSVIRGYEQNGQVTEVKNLLENSRAEIQKLGADSQHYESLKGFYTTISSYLDMCSNPELSFTQFTEMQNQYEKEARDYINDLGFTFG